MRHGGAAIKGRGSGARAAALVTPPRGMLPLQPAEVADCAGGCPAATPGEVSMLRALSLLCLGLALGACSERFGPSSSGGAVEAKPGEAIVVAGFDVLGGAPGLVDPTERTQKDLAGDEAGEFRLAFHAYDPASQTFVNPPRAFYLEQSCAAGDAGVRACAASARHFALAVPPGDYILAFVDKSFWGYIPPNEWQAGHYGLRGALLPLVEITNTNRISGSYAAVPGASMAGSTAPRFRVAAGETLYIGFLVIEGATWHRDFGVANGAYIYGLADAEVAVESRPDQARAALEKAGLPAAGMVERLAAAP